LLINANDYARVRANGKLIRESLKTTGKAVDKVDEAMSWPGRL
jgi:hypothetical protein